MFWLFKYKAAPGFNHMRNPNVQTSPTKITSNPKKKIPNKHSLDALYISFLIVTSKVNPQKIYSIFNEHNHHYFKSYLSFVT